MTIDQHNEKLLIDYNTELQGMIAENRQREFEGNAPAYREDAFMNLSNKYHEALYKY